MQRMRAFGKRYRLRTEEEIQGKNAPITRSHSPAVNARPPPQRYSITAKAMATFPSGALT